jgi:anti-sigma regulatory factor (Ser/Thr protein kinase)
MTVIRDLNTIRFNGSFKDVDLHAPLACLHHAVVEGGFRNIVLDFSQCTGAFSGAMLALCAEVLRLRSEQIDFSLLQPRQPTLERLFNNTNWANFLEPRRFAPSKFKGYTQIPVIQFNDPSGQNHAVNRIINAVLGGIPDIRRSDFAALEWAINELTDNVIVHSQSPIGGLVQVSNFRRDRKIIEFIIADAGKGIPQTLRSGGAFTGTDVSALDQAIREGITRDKSLGQGNGLYGSYQICSHSGGEFRIDSGHGKLHYTNVKGLELRDQKVPVHGTLIVAKIDFTNPDLLREALSFAGKRHVPVDYIETKYEQNGTNVVHFRIADEAESFGSRVGGTPVATKLGNLIRMCPGQPIEVDFDSVPLISSSFADEVFGKLFVKLGPLQFMQRIRFKNVVPTVQALVDKAIAQRVATGLGK